MKRTPWKKSYQLNNWIIINVIFWRQIGAEEKTTAIFVLFFTHNWKCKLILFFLSVLYPCAQLLTANKAKITLVWGREKYTSEDLKEGSESSLGRVALFSDVGQIVYDLNFQLTLNALCQLLPDTFYVTTTEMSSGKAKENVRKLGNSKEHL